MTPGTSRSDAPWPFHLPEAFGIVRQVNHRLAMIERAGQACGLELLVALPGLDEIEPQHGGCQQHGAEDPAQCRRVDPDVLQADAKITKVMIGRMYRSGAREENVEPMRTAGTLPMMMDAVTGKAT